MSHYMNLHDKIVHRDNNKTFGFVILFRMKRLLCIGMLFYALGAKAQMDVAFTNTWALQPFYNPAATGLDSKLNVLGAYSMQMVGFEDAPAAMFLNADMPAFFLGPSHGMGIGMLNDKAALFNSQKFYVQYAYHLKLGKKKAGKLSVGIRVAVLSEGFDGTDLDLNDPNDPAFATSKVKGTGFDLDLGVRYSHRDLWYAGISTMHTLGPSIGMGDEKLNKINIDPVYMVSGGYKLKFRQPQYRLAADALVRTDFLSWRADLNARLLYEGAKNKLYGGVMYSPLHSVGAMLGFDFHGISIGYSYEFYTSGIGALHGTHEIMIGYQTDLNLFKKGKNLHKSVRIL